MEVYSQLQTPFPSTQTKAIKCFPRKRYIKGENIAKDRDDDVDGGGGGVDDGSDINGLYAYSPFRIFYYISWMGYLYNRRKNSGVLIKIFIEFVKRRNISNQQTLHIHFLCRLLLCVPSVKRSEF